MIVVSKNITSVYSLKAAYESRHPNGHFFDSDTLKFFGERLSEMRVLKGTVEITNINGEKHICYMLSKYSRNYPTGAKRTYAYFDVDTFDEVIR